MPTATRIAMSAKTQERRSGRISPGPVVTDSDALAYRQPGDRSSGTGCSPHPRPLAFSNLFGTLGARPSPSSRFHADETLIPPSVASSCARTLTRSVVQSSHNLLTGKHRPRYPPLTPPCQRIVLMLTMAPGVLDSDANCELAPSDSHFIRDHTGACHRLCHPRVGTRLNPGHHRIRRRVTSLAPVRRLPR